MIQKAGGWEYIRKKYHMCELYTHALLQPL